MKALEYEAVNQTDQEDATDPAGQSTKKRHRTLLWTAMTNGPPMIQRQSQYSYAAVLLIFTLMLLVTPELIQSEHGTISSAFFAPSSPEDITCSDATLEISKNNHMYGCISDRLQNNEVLGRGTMLCSEGGRYSFGFAKSSNALVWRDCRDGLEREYYRCPSPKDCAYVLSKDGAFTITEGDLSQNNMGKVVYKKLSNIYVDAGESSNEECLDEPRYDCPYIHLHSSGKLVLHYIDEKGAFKQKVHRPHHFRPYFDDAFPFFPSSQASSVPFLDASILLPLPSLVSSILLPLPFRLCAFPWASNSCLSRHRRPCHRPPT